MGLAEDNTIPTKLLISKQQSPTQEKQEAIKPRSNVAIAVKKKKGKNRKFLQCHTLSTGSINSNPHLNQPKEKNENKGNKKDFTPEGRNGIRKIKNRLNKLN